MWNQWNDDFIMLTITLLLYGVAYPFFLNSSFISKIEFRIDLHDQARHPTLYGSRQANLFYRIGRHTHLPADKSTVFSIRPNKNNHRTLL